jgi:hypothetical protein
LVRQAKPSSETSLSSTRFDTRLDVKNKLAHRALNKSEPKSSRVGQKAGEPLSGPFLKSGVRSRAGREQGRGPNLANLVSSESDKTQNVAGPSATVKLTSLSSFHYWHASSATGKPVTQGG